MRLGDRRPKMAVASSEEDEVASGDRQGLDGESARDERGVAMEEADWGRGR